MMTPQKINFSEIVSLTLVNKTLSFFTSSNAYVFDDVAFPSKNPAVNRAKIKSPIPTLLMAIFLVKGFGNEDVKFDIVDMSISIYCSCVKIKGITNKKEHVTKYQNL